MAIAPKRHWPTVEIGDYGMCESLVTGIETLSATYPAVRDAIPKEVFDIPAFARVVREALEDSFKEWDCRRHTNLNRRFEKASAKLSTHFKEEEQ